MRDTEQLRRRLWAQIGLPVATVALLGACDGGTQVQPVKVDPSEAEASGVAKKRPETKDAKPPPLTANSDAGEEGDVEATHGIPANYDEIPDGEFDYFGPARDPFNAHDEEEGCPSGDWCGAPDDARKFGVAHLEDQIGCPAKIIAHAEVSNGLNKDDKRWKGLSFHPMMQGRLMTSVTEEARAGGQAGVCCYHWFEYCSGRPLLDGEVMVVAKVREGSSWSCEPGAVAAPDDRPDAELPADLRERLGQLWLDDALMEHASIAAFARATLELMAMAAPPDLLGEIQVAADDEIEHAMRCFGLAQRFSGRAREPGELTPLEPRVLGLVDVDPASAQAGADWVRLALDTFVEGCVGETIAALVARRGMRRCEDPATSETLERIVDDEGRHAGLAWQTIRWILEDSGVHRETVLAALDEQAQAMAAKARAACDDLPEADPLASSLARFGRLDRRAELLAQRDAWSELILPTLGAIVHADKDERGPEAWT